MHRQTMLFKNRKAAGQLLAGQLADYANRSDVLVLALPRGGVPVAFEIAQVLQVPLDVLLVRKLGVPGQEELAMGAIASGGVKVLNRDIVRDYRFSEAEVAPIVAREQQELERREHMYRPGLPAPAINGQTVILVDDGLATGATMRAAIVTVQQHDPAQVIVAVPIAALETCDTIGAMVDRIICAETPRPFGSVGAWYEDFSQTTDAEVQRLLKQITPAQ